MILPQDFSVYSKLLYGTAAHRLACLPDVDMSRMKLDLIDRSR
jgi:hypothetical protein